MAGDPFDFSGKVAWVTGSSRGVGRGVALHLAAHGASVVIHARSGDHLDGVAGELEAAGASYLRTAADIRDRGAVQAVADAIQERFGRLDGLVCNVGSARPAPLADTTPETLRLMLDVNLAGALYCAQAALPMLRSARGAIVMVSAVGAHSLNPGTGAYGAAKAGLEHLTRTAAAEWGPEVRVNCVSLGLIVTEGSRRVVFGDSDERVAAAASATAVGRLGRPEDVAWACHYLLSPAASFVSGATLTVDGGETEGPAQRLLRPGG